MYVEKRHQVLMALAVATGQLKAADARAVLDEHAERYKNDKNYVSPYEETLLLECGNNGLEAMRELAHATHESLANSYNSAVARLDQRGKSGKKRGRHGAVQAARCD